MKKRIIITLLIFLSFNINLSFAEDWACNIWDSTAEVLSNYIKNNQTIIQNITNEISSSNVNQESSNKFTRLYNNIINWTWYKSYFNYYVVFPLTNDIPIEVQRDYNILDNEWKWLEKYLKTISKKWYDIEINNETLCDWVEQNCNILNWNAISIVWELIKNQSKIIDIYRRAVMWDLKKSDEIWDLLLVDNTNNVFVEEIINNYWLGNNCVKSENSFFAQIKNAVTEIWELNEEWKKWIEDWQEAIALIRWEKDTEELEKELLANELSRQWISWDRAKAILNNLEEFNNEWWFSIENNFITNTFEYFTDSITRQFSQFKTDIIDSFWDNFEKESIKITTVIDDKDTSEINQIISESVATLYNTELQFAWLSNQESILIRADVLEMHTNLNKSIKILKELIPVAEKVCDKQDKWNWACTTN